MNILQTPDTTMLDLTDAAAGERPSSCTEVQRLRFQGDAFVHGTRALAEECPVSLTYDGTSHAVMMASPLDLEDFALGFSLTEDIVSTPDGILDLEILPAGEGYEARMRLGEGAAGAFAKRRRRLAGPVGCGLCGLESIEEALRPSPRYSKMSRPIDRSHVLAARAALEEAQHAHHRTQALHAAGLWTAEAGLLAIREDVGRHNALDKLVGAVARSAVETCDAVLVLTSRLSVDLIQKASRLGAPVVAAMSAPTKLAVDAAATAGLTLIAVARSDGFEIYTHAERIR